MNSIPSPARGGRFDRLKKQALLIGGFFLLLLICNVTFLHGVFFTPANLKAIVSQAVFPSFVAWGLSFILSAKLVELSAGANTLLAANIGAALAVNAGLGYPGLILGAIITSVICEQISIRCCIGFKLPPWVNSLGMALIFEAVLGAYSNYRAEKLGLTLVNLGMQYRELGTMPVIAVVWVIGALCAYFLYCKSSIGISVRAIGGNPSVAEAMGINRRKTIYIAAFVGSLFFGMGSAIRISYSALVYAQSGLGSISTIFKALATLLLGQSIEGIIELPFGIMLSSFMVWSLGNILTHLGVPTGTGQEICFGALVIISGILSHMGNKGVSK